MVTSGDLSAAVSPWGFDRLLLKDGGETLGFSKLTSEINPHFDITDVRFLYFYACNFLV